MNKSYKSSLNRIELVVFDFDGVFTDNRVWVDSNGNETVCCNRSDGIGLEKLRDAGVKTLMISRETNLVVQKRAKKLNIPCVSGIRDKLKVLKEFAISGNFRSERIAYVGNDLNDLECMQWVGMPVAVNDAYPEVRKSARLVLNKKGGEGAVREFCDITIAAKTESSGEMHQVTEPIKI